MGGIGVCSISASSAIAIVKSPNYNLYLFRILADKTHIYVFDL